jgi:hypothetical protein
MSRDGRIRTCVLLLPKQAGWPDSPTSRGAPGEIQTPDLLVRSQALSFTELRGRERAKSFRSHVPQLQLPPSRRPLRPGGDFSSRSVRWPPVASREVPGPARIAPLCGSSQAAPGFPECPEEDSNPLAPTWRAGRAAGHEEGRPAGPPSARTLDVVTSAVTSVRPRMSSRGKRMPACLAEGVMYLRHAAARRYTTLRRSRGDASPVCLLYRSVSRSALLNDEGRPGIPGPPSARSVWRAV